MAFTRFNYDECRTAKLLQESTGPGRYMLDVPGWGAKPCFFDDPQIRMQEWGANLRKVPQGAPIDIDSDLIGITRPYLEIVLAKNTQIVVLSDQKEYPILFVKTRLLMNQEQHIRRGCIGIFHRITDIFCS